MSIVKTTSSGKKIFRCPGCDHYHSLRVTGDDHPKWEFNGDHEKPTFKPSILESWNWGDNEVKEVCHSFVTDGKIQFLNDCTHKLARQTIDIPPWPHAPGEFGGVID